MPPAFQQRYRPLLALSLPLIFAHVIEAFVPFINTLMAAKISHEALAALGVALPMFFSTMGFCWGAITALAIMCSHDIGAQRTDRLGAIVKTGMLLAFLFAIPVIIIFTQMEKILLAFGQEAGVAQLAQAYFYGVTVSVFPGLAKFALLQFAIALNKPRLVLIASCATIPLVIFLNDALAWGRYGLPELGMLGIGLGTALAHSLVFLGVLVVVFKLEPFSGYLSQKAKWREYWQLLQEYLRLGAPIGGMYIVEIFFFAVIALMMGWVNTQSLAAHQIVMQWEFMSVMVAMGFAEAVIILVGKAAGGNNLDSAKGYVIAGVVISSLFMLVNALIFWLLPGFLIGVDLAIDHPDNTALVSLSTQFFLLCGVFIVINCLRIVTSGGLRGLKDTKYPLWVAIFAFWFCALPSSYIFAFIFDMQGAGLWLGILIGVTISCVLQGRRLYGKLS